MAQLNSQHDSQKKRMAEKHALNSVKTGGGFPYSYRSSRVVPPVVLPETQLFEEGQLYSLQTTTVKVNRLYFPDLTALAILTNEPSDMTIRPAKNVPVCCNRPIHERFSQLND
jgi:hypothetical protein